MTTRKRLRTVDWVYKKIEQLRPFYEVIRDIEPYIYFQTKGGWCLLKLAVLANYIDTYTMIIRNRMPGLADEMVFIDLLAGSGVTYVRSFDFFLPGSSIIAATAPRKPEYQFDKLITIDQNPISCRALRERLAQFQMSQRHIALEGDANVKIDDVIQQLTPRTHYLAFVDNQGFDTNWSTVEKLLDYRGDIFINFPTSSMGRVWGHAKQGKLKQVQVMNRFFGDRMWEQARSRKDLLELYTDKIKDYKSDHSRVREIIRIIPVFGERKFGRKYDLIFATVLTKSGSKWVGSLDRLIERAQKLRNGLIDELIKIYKGEQKTLNGYFGARK